MDLNFEARRVGQNLMFIKGHFEGLQVYSMCSFDFPSIDLNTGFYFPSELCFSLQIR